MSEKYVYGPLIYNYFGEDDDSGNYWWSGSPPVGYEQESGMWRIPVDKYGNQCLDGESILHPNCRVEEFEYNEVFEADLPKLEWCRKWFDENFLIVTDKLLVKYIFRWHIMNTCNNDANTWKHLIDKYESMDKLMEAAWPDVMTS